MGLENVEVHALFYEVMGGRTGARDEALTNGPALGIPQDRAWILRTSLWL